MQPSTDSFAAELRTGAQYAARVCVFIGDQIYEDTFYGGTELGLLAENSSVQYDRLADTRSTADISFLIKTDLGRAILDPTRFPEVVVYSGIKVGTEYEWIQMGTFGIHTTTFSRTTNAVTATCSTADRSGRVRDNPWREPFQIAAGLDYFVAAKNVIDNRAKGFTPVYNFGSSALTTPTINNSESDDPWGVVVKLAEAVGCEVFFDRQGAVSMFPVPDPLLVAPALIIGPYSGVQLSPVSREISNREVFNGVICRAEAPWLLFPVSDEIWDEDPLSPSYRLGSFGEKPKVIGDALATTQAQCLTTATAEFRKIAGVMEAISFSTIKDPRLEAGDVIEQIDDYLGVVGRYVLDTYTYPLGSGEASGTVRRKR